MARARARSGPRPGDLRGNPHPGCHRAKVFWVPAISHTRSGRLVGLGVARPEQTGPNWFHLPLFVEIRDWWRRRFPDWRSGYAFRAAEDFAHPIQGRRQIAEALGYVPWEPRDRLGHALALGLSALDWQAEHELVVAPLDTQFFDCLWEWGLHTREALDPDPRLVYWYESRIAELARRLFPGPRIELEALEPMDRGFVLAHLVQQAIGAPVYWRGVRNYRADTCRACIS